MSNERIQRSGMITADNRAGKWAMLCTLRVLRESVRRNRPVSLPNLMRVYRRKMAVRRSATPADAGVTVLARLYRAEQPFRTTNWREIKVLVALPVRIRRER